MSQIMEHFISADEAEVYDRQIRLWGVEAQKSLRRASILIIGCKGYGAEICKNLLLAGVKSLTILDDENVNEDDIQVQLLLTREHIGKNRAEASLAKMHLLNPLVDIKADIENINNKSDEYFKDFQVICATDCTFNELLHLNDICQKYNIKFFCGDIYGLFGYFFTDLGEHEFVMELNHQPPPLNSNTNDKIIKAEEPKPKTEKRTAIFTSLKETFNYDYKNDKNFQNKLKRMKRMDFSYFIVLILKEFYDLKKRKPLPQNRNEDIELLKELRKKYLNELNVHENLITDFTIENIFIELPFISGIVGGVLAQEIIKAITKQGKPHQNMFFFNPQTCKGLIGMYPPKN